MKFKFYVINYNINKRKCEMFNIFNNIKVSEQTEKAVKKYLRSPKKFKTYDWSTREYIYGWDAFVKEIDSIIKCEEWGRCEYEISANEKFVTEASDIIRGIEKYDTLEEVVEYLKEVNRRNRPSVAFDCYEQCKPNMECIAHEVIRQYKEYKRNEENENKC